MLTLDVEFGPDRPDGSVWVVRVDLDGAWGDAGGAAGDLCCTIDGVPASQALAELAASTRPRVAGEAITVELERLGERLTIYPCWRDIPDNQPQEIDELALAPGRTPADLVTTSDEGSEANVQAPLFVRLPVFQNLPKLPPDHKRERPPNYTHAHEWNPFPHFPDHGLE
jgi:hypothetical protein